MAYNYLRVLVLLIGGAGLVFGAGPVAAGVENRTGVRFSTFGVQEDTVTVQGRLAVVGNEPFTRLRLIEKGGGGYMLDFEEVGDVELRQTESTRIRATGVPYTAEWQGRETRFLRVVDWEYIERDT